MLKVIKWKPERYHTVRTVPQSYRIIAKKNNNQTPPPQKKQDRNWHIYDFSFSWLGTSISINSVGVKLVLWDQASTLRDYFTFPIVKCPFIWSNIPAYGAYISQLILYSRACGSYQDFLESGLLLIRKLLNQDFLVGKLKSSLQKLCDRYHDLVNRYVFSVS